MRKSSLALVRRGLGTGLLWVVGCTHQDPANRSVEKLRADIAKIEADRDRLDQRVGALEAAEQRRQEEPDSAARKAPGEPAAPFAGRARGRRRRARLGACSSARRSA